MADEKTLLQDPEFVEELIRYSDYYHVLGAKKIETGNPFDELFKEDYFRDNPHLALVSLFRDTRFLGYTAKRLFNLDLVPFQVASLQTLWNHTFPMLLASRGASKSFMLAVYCWYKALLVPKSRIIVTGGAFRQSKVVLGYMENIFNNSPVLQDIVGYGSGKGLRKDIDRYTYYVGDSEVIGLPCGDGCVVPETKTIYESNFGQIGDMFDLTNKYQHTNKNNKKLILENKIVESDEQYCIGLKPTIKIKTKKGYSLEGSYNHQIKIVRNGTIKFMRLDQVVSGDSVVIDRTPYWHNGNIDASIEECYALGLMISDGSYVQDYFLHYTTQDPELIEAIKVGIPHKWKQYDKVHWQCNGKAIATNWKRFWGLNKTYTKDKSLPEKILSASKEQMAACISGLFDSDGYANISMDKRGGTAITIGFTSISEKLITQLHYILLRYGIVSTLSFRYRPCRVSRKLSKIFELRITGKNVNIFVREIGFKLTRKQLATSNGLVLQKLNSTFECVPQTKELMLEYMEIAKKSKITPNKKPNSNTSFKRIAVRNSITMSLLENWLLRYKDVNHEILDKLRILLNKNYFYDTINSISYDNKVVYDLHIPNTHEYNTNGFISHNSKIRGMRATTIVVDEFLSLRKDIYEETISAFAAVSANPSLSHKDWAVREILKKLGRLSKEQEANEVGSIVSNQSIIAGTCSYTFEHFYEYWDRYHKIIASGGDKKKLSQALNGDVDDNFDYKDYAIIRLPVEILPPNFMDEKNIIRAKATIDSGVFLKEYACIFPKDSSGFFKRSLIESCVGTDLRPIELSSGPVFFDVAMAGNRTKKYVMGVDPAAEQDNFAISLIEIWPDHRRLVYVWTTNLKDHRAKVKAQLVREHDYYGYCARKIRDLMKVFNVERIALDKQGGGRALLEALHDKDKIDDDEVPIYEIIDDNKEKDTDNLPGLHIVEVASVSKEDWITGANHGLRKDMEDKALLFPQFDPVSLEIAIQADKHTNKQFDTFEDAVLEIEELKDELSTIVVTRTDNGREHFDTPEIKLSTGKKGRLKKDRYSALLMANMTARTMARLVPDAPYNAYGGLARQSSQSDNSGQLYTGAEWMSNSAYSKSNHNSIVEGNRKIVY